MSKADEVIKRITEENEVISIKIIGNDKNKADGFYILMNTQQIISDEKDVFHCIKKKTLSLLNEAGIRYEII